MLPPRIVRPGEERYQVFIMCPGFTNYFYDDTFDKNGGLVMFSTDEPDFSFDILAAFMDKLDLSYSMMEIFDYDMTEMSQHGLIWAWKMHFELMYPAACETGNVSFGTVPL